MLTDGINGRLPIFDHEKKNRKSIAHTSKMPLLPFEAMIYIVIAHEAIESAKNHLRQREVIYFIK